ncbi:efflux RND transporter permease subunit [Botrimarina sp.]|uniref:efflux RND transporter permease subunit n=1 Tax=Botrimarina sp. TaxID=2795802 RepID=UPI0032EAB2B1
MNLVDSFIRNPVKVAVGVLLLTLFGSVALLRMPMQLTPEVQTPTITVTTTWAGASPQEVEREITIEQEEQLKGVEGARKLTSESTDSQSTITIEFNVGEDMDQALLKVNSRLQQVPEYPEDADQPVIVTANSSSRPIAWFILSPAPPTEETIAKFAAEHPDLRDEVAQIASTENLGLQLLRIRRLVEEHPEAAPLAPPPGLDIPKLQRFAEDEIEARFERVSGVSQSNVLGGLEDELQVVVDPERLAARQVTLTQVRDVLRGQNKDTSAGDFSEDKRRWVVRTLGEFRSPEQVENQLLAVRDGAPVYVRDVAEVRFGYKKPTGLVRRFGESCIAVNCIRETGANVLDVMDGLSAVTEQLNADVLAPRGLRLTQVYDETEYINSSVSLVQNNIFIGGALTMLVLMGFLHFGVRTLAIGPVVLATALAAAYLSPWWFAACLAVVIGAGFWYARGALVVGLAIPVSIVGTFLVLGALGRSLNVISLAGLAFAVGMLVDNAVVVLENIYRRRSLGEAPFVAAARGTQEVWGAVVSSTLTTIAVFLPVVFVEEQAGQLFRDIALAISAAVGLSLLVSVVMIPTASARLLSRPIGPSSESDSEPSSNFWTDAIVAVNGWVQGSVLRRVATVAVLVGLSVGLSLALWPRVEYLPTGNRNLVFGIVVPPPGYNIEQLMTLGETVERELRPLWDIDPDAGPNGGVAAETGPAIGDFFFVVRGRSVFLGVRALDPLRSAELVPVVSSIAGKLPGAFVVAKQSSLFEDGLTAGRTIDVEITGPDVVRLVELSRVGLGAVAKSLPGAQARPVPSPDLSSPELHVVPKLLQAAETQMTSSDIGFAVDALVDGAYVGDYFLEGKKIDLTVVGERRFADATQMIGAAPIATPLGQLVPLSALAEVSLASGPEQINHRERVRAITIEVSPPPEVALEDAMNTIRDEVVPAMRATGMLGGPYSVALAGTADKLRETWDALRFNVLLALLITYLLMAALFESWLYPFVIILTVPLGAVGGILGLSLLNLFVNQPLDVLTMLGFVVLIGTVVNNPILIVHQALNLIREEGADPRAAVLESVRTRVRPIFMTTTTTLLGLAPLVIFPGAGSELYRGLGSVVLGGLVVSTAFTLLLAPTLFTLALDAKWALLGRRRGDEPGDTADAEPPVRKLAV